MLYDHIKEYRNVEISNIAMCAKLATRADFTGFPDAIGDGVCNLRANNRFCNYDFGDCCMIDVFENSKAWCHDPWCTCHLTGQVPTYMNEMFVQNGKLYSISEDDCLKYQVSDGICDKENFNEVCHYDGGDCLVYDYKIKDCEVDPKLLGNGFCNPEANHPGCSFDKNDCCLPLIHGPDCPEPQGFASNQSRPCTCHKTGLDHPLILSEDWAIGNAQLQ